ncbi:cation-translocating P-type ATPase [Methanoculleus sp.]|uniref:cation-translocating P-type ATPase n=1 Tax=Methanoculleus sp. TaxID=90427 RepID=UPI002FC6260C
MPSPAGATSDVDPGSLSGLSTEQVVSKLREEGYNELPPSDKRGLPEILLGVIREPMFILLVAGGLIYVALGDIREALMLLSFVFVVIGITVYQEQKTERALEALRDLSSPRALVIREGEQKRIPGREVVSRDILVVSEGDRVPADAVLISANNLLVDESLLTGESVPARKVPWHDGMTLGRPGGEDQPMVYSGTLVVQGQGLAEVRSTGPRTEMGKIGTVLTSVERSKTRLKGEIDRLVRDIALLGLGLVAVIVVVYGLTRFNWTGGFLAGITLAMAILPEELPVVLTIFLALGAWRIAGRNVLTRQAPAIETLGSATVLCVDKTGTLTQNRMTVRKLFAHGRECEYDRTGKTVMPEFCHELVEFGILACKRDPFDPMEKALRQLTEDLAQTEHVHEDWDFLQEYPLSQELLAMSNVWRSREGGGYVVAAKGAPEAIADLCHLNDREKEELQGNVNTMAAGGLRVLGVARATLPPATLPDIQHAFSFTFLGLVGFADPVRQKVPEALRECYLAGVRVIMITGDYPLTAQKIADQIGLTRVEEYITGPELEAMSDEELSRRIASVNIFARVVPEQKLRIVKALKARGETVAMTGDGVNDAPALKAADIGIAMGERGTDVAREASSLVLLDDNFTSIVAAIRMGRRIFDNLKKAIAYIFSIHIPIAGMSLLPVLFGWPLVLLPVHIVFLELIIDPACSVVFESEPEEADVMKRAPRNAKEGLLTRKMVAVSALQGAVVLAIVVLVYFGALMRNIGESEARTLAFSSIVIANLSLILTNRSWSETFLTTIRRPNRAFWLVLGGALLFLTLVLTVPALLDLFHFSPLDPADIGLSFGAGVFSVLWFEIYKAWTKRAHSAGRRTIG